MANGYPSDPPPAYDDHDDFDDIDNSVFEQQSDEPVTGRYKKKETKKGGGARERSSSASSVRVQLNRLSEREVDDAKMATVFGKEEEEEKERRRNSMKVNPLYDQNGTVEVPSNEAPRVRSGSYSGETEQNATLPKYSSKPYKKSKRKANSDDEDDSNTGPEPKIAYSKNFRFKGPSKPNGQLNGQAGNKKITSGGRIMPSRISRNAIPGSQIMASLSGKERPKPKPDYRPEHEVHSHPDNVEAAERRSEIRKKWRLVIALILIVLIFALILVIVLYFATKGA